MYDVNGKLLNYEKSKEVFQVKADCVEKINMKIVVKQLRFVKLQLENQDDLSQNYTSNVYWLVQRMDELNWTSAATNFYQTNLTYMADLT